MSGTISELQRDRGVGSLIGSDGKTYLFHRGAVQDGWFHELRPGDAVTFEPGNQLRAERIRVLRASPDTSDPVR